MILSIYHIGFITGDTNMSLNVTNLSVNYYEDITKVTVEIYEMMGTMEKFKDKLILTLPGRIQSIDDDLVQKIDEELEKNNYNYLTVTE